MKHLLILISLIILITSCKETPVEFVEVPINPPQEIEHKTNLVGGKYIKDSDTLKIEILDTTLVTSHLTESFITFEGIVKPSKLNTDNPVYEYLSRDLTKILNPDNKYELWVYGFKPNLDSTKQKQIGRFLNYEVTLGSPFDRAYYINNKITFDVVSTTE